MLKEKILFLQEFFTQFKSTGTFFPTSRWAAQELITPIIGSKSRKRILEVGPGTGSVTVEILKAMQPGDELAICEINSRFMVALKERLEKNPDFLRHKSNVTFFEGPIQNFVPADEKKFDLICCALPFLNFEVSLIKEIFAKFFSLAHENTLLTYYEYLGLRALNKAVSTSNRRRRIIEIETYFSEFWKKRRLRSRRIWRNLLPINVYTLKLAA